MPVVESDGRTPELRLERSQGDHADRPLVPLQRGCHGRAPGDRWHDLSGRTKDLNIDYIAEYLTAVGINLREVRVVGGEPPPRWGFGGLKIFFHPPGPGRLRDWLRGPPLVREILLGCGARQTADASR